MDHQISANFSVQAGRHRDDAAPQASVVEEVAAAIRAAAQIPARDEDERLAHKILRALDVLAARAPATPPRPTAEQVASFREKLAEMQEAPQPPQGQDVADNDGVALQAMRHPEQSSQEPPSELGGLLTETPPPSTDPDSAA